VLTIEHASVKTPEFDDFFRRQFERHIVKHFNLRPEYIEARLGVSSSGIENFLSLSYHYRKNHHHVNSHGANVFKSGKKLITELEKIIRKNKKK
tara:strand:+ start:1528 stop:1809 length:282 start_codon:yes stop_codon:yes gene_type:complete